VTKQCLQNLDRQVQARQQPVVETAAEVDGARTTGPTAVAEAPPAPSQTEFMLAVGEEMLADFIPDPKQRRMVAGLALAALFIGFLSWYAEFVARKVAKRMQEDSAQ